ncbi:hypothetical protein ACSSV4_003215 [Roseovarius sp. MBR-154]|jgi:hypothetical protein
MSLPDPNSRENHEMDTIEVTHCFQNFTLEGHESREIALLQRDVPPVPDAIVSRSAWINGRLPWPEFGRNVAGA